MIVVIPCWRRPAHLAALLRTIERARLADQQRYLFMVDRGHAPEIDDVIESFTLGKQIAGVFYQGDHGYSGPAYNILRGWSAAISMNEYQPIGLLEEDLLVADDLFEFWHDAMEMGPVGVSACRNQNMAPAETPGIGAAIAGLLRGPAAPYVYRHVSYQSLAVALRPEIVEEVVLHATPDYFGDPQGYVLKYLPDPGLPASACSQDGLFHRCLRKWNLGMLYPIVPRACHVGWYGYNRPEGRGIIPAGNWRSGAELILAMPSEEMNEYADPRFRDIERCGLIRQRVDLQLV